MPRLERGATAKRKDDRRARTRERLLGAAIELLRAEGLRAVTVSRITRRVSVHHSLFYAHFEDLNACLAAAAQRVIETLAPTDRALRRELLRRAVLDRRELHRYFEGALARWLEQRPFVELLLGHRLDRSPLGDALRPALSAIRDETAAELADLAAELGLPRERPGEVDTLADLHLSHWLWGLERVIEGRAPDRAALAAVLADLYVSTNLAFLERAQRPSYEQLVAARFAPAERAALDQLAAEMRALVLANDDAALIASFGSAEGLIDALLEAQCRHFLPHAARGASAIVHYRVQAPDGEVLRRICVRDDRCASDARCRDELPRCTLSLSLRTLCETMTGVRHFHEAFREGALRVEGDLPFAIAFYEWFYVPHGALGR